MATLRRQRWKKVGRPIFTKEIMFHFIAQFLEKVLTADS